MNDILIIEDEEHINNLIKEALTKEGYQCTQAYSGSEALLWLRQQEYALILLDLMLPGMKGEQVLEAIRKEYKIPVIIVSAIDDLDRKVDLLTLGAEDYITKPFELKELIARVSVQLRRGQATTNNGTENEDLLHKELRMNMSTYEVTIRGEQISLTRQELRILELLLKHPNKVFSKQEIYEYAWDDYYVGEDKTINVHISNIRSKIKKVCEEDYIDTVWGIGFKLAK